MSRYTSVTAADRAAMLEAIGVADVEELFDAIPADVRLARPLELDPGRPEQEVFAELRAMAAANRSAEDEVSFLGAGMYDHYTPALIDSITQRSEFLTPYTPYQPEISQGGLQGRFEYQTMISELTGLPVSNSSLYEGPFAVASAGYLAKLETGRHRFVVSRGLHPHSRETLDTYSRGFGTEVTEVPLSGGATAAPDLAAAIDGDVAAVFVQQPNFLGAVEDLGAQREAIDAAAEAAGAKSPLLVCAADPLTLGVLRPPGDFGADVCVGEGQALGGRLDYGGPSFGFFCAQQRYLRRMPGRIAGQTTDVDGRRGFVLALQTREQHIRRERATSNICTSQWLCALAGAIYLSWLGREGIREIGELMAQRTAYARELLCGLDGVEALHEQPVVREFALRLEAPVGAVLDRLAEQGIRGGYELGRSLPEHPDGLLVAITERRSREQIDRLAQALGAAVVAERGQAPEPRAVA